MQDKQKRKALVQFALLCALFSWGVLCYAKLGEFMYKGTLFARMIDGRPYVSDFTNVYNAGVLAKECLSGEKLDVYDIKVQSEHFNKLIAPIVPEQPFYLQYPPYFFLLTMPLSLVPMNLAWIIWNLLGAGLSILGLNRLSKQLGMESLERKKLLAFFMSSYPAWLTVELGQTSFFLLAAATYFISFLKERRFVAAGLSASILMVKLQYAPMFFLIGVIFGRLKFASTLGLALAILLGLSTYVLGWNTIVNYPHSLISGETGTAVSGVSAFMMQNIRGEMVLFLREDSGTLKKIVVGLFGIASVFSAWQLLAAAKEHPARFDTTTAQSDISSTHPVAPTTQSDPSSTHPVAPTTQSDTSSAQPVAPATQSDTSSAQPDTSSTAEGDSIPDAKIPSELSSPRKIDFAIALALIIALLASPHTHVQDYVLIALPAVLILGNIDPSEATARKIRSMFVNFVPLSWLFFYIQPLALMIYAQLTFLYWSVAAVLIYFGLVRQRK